MKSMAYLCIFLFVSTTISGWAGGGPQNVLLVVNDNAPESLRLGNAYRDLRQIPGRNIFHIQTTSITNITTVDFTNQIRGPILQYLSDSGLSNQITTIVFSKDIPYHVNPTSSRSYGNGLTSAMYYDYKYAPAPCSLPTNTINPYFETEQPFQQVRDGAQGPIYLCTMLTGYSVSRARQALDAAYVADGTAPVAPIILYEHSTDLNRNVRWPQFELADFLYRVQHSESEGLLYDGNSWCGETNVLGYVAGQYAPGSLSCNTLLPGAIGDHLTSFGGDLYNELDAYNQQSALDWISAGYVGSYGTVVEPCNYTNKFPQARLHFWYGRGFNLAESYMLAIQNPYQGLLVGDPLCAPYAIPPHVVMGGMTSNQTVSGSVVLNVTGQSTHINQRIDRLELFLDDLYLSTLTNVSLNAGTDAVSFSINGHNKTYNIAASDTNLADVAEGIAHIINSPWGAGISGISANAHFDRLDVTQDDQGVAGASIPCTASATGNVHAWTSTNTLIESFYPARRIITTYGVPTSGDVLRCTITRLDGLSFTNSVTADTNSTSSTLLSDLMSEINADTNLQEITGCQALYKSGYASINYYEMFLVARTNGWNTYNLQVDYEVLRQGGSALTNTEYSGKFSSNEDVMSARGMIFLTQGHTNLQATYTLDTTQLSDGPHNLRAIAYEGSATAIQGHYVLPFFVSNHTASCHIDIPASGTYLPYGQTATVTVSAASTSGITNLLLYVQGKPYASAATNNASWALDTTPFGAGLLDLQALATETSGQSVLSAPAQLIIWSDQDADGMSDEFEYTYFNDETTASPGEDIDDDNSSNYREYLADTDPTDSNSTFRILTLQPPSPTNNLRISFTSTTTRQYQVEAQTNSLAGTAPWTGITTNALPGQPNTTTWTAPAAPTSTTVFYRIQTQLPTWPD